MGRVAWWWKSCCVENESTPSSFDVDALRNLLAARFAVCMLAVFTRPGPGVLVVVAHRRFAFWNPLFSFEMNWSVI